MTATACKHSSVIDALRRHCACLWVKPAPRKAAIHIDPLSVGRLLCESVRRTAARATAPMHLRTSDGATCKRCKKRYRGRLTMRPNRILATLSVLVQHHHLHVYGLTRGDIRKLAQLPADCEITRPLRDLRKPPYELRIECAEVNENGERVWRYRLGDEGFARAVNILNQHKRLSMAPESDPGINPTDPATVADVPPSASATHSGQP